MDILILNVISYYAVPEKGFFKVDIPFLGLNLNLPLVILLNFLFCFLLFCNGTMLNT